LSTVLDLLTIVALIAGCVLYLLGLGWLAVGPLLHGSLFKRRRDTLLVEEFPLILLGGFILNFGILLVVQKLNLSLIVGGVLALAGLVFFGIYLFRHHIGKVRNPDSLNKWVGVVFLNLLLTGPILTSALMAWDARSIWYFHAKMIYFAGSIGLEAGWTDPTVIFSQLDYPKLVPALASQIMYIMGFWNEYLPKLSLFLAFIPAVTWLVTFARKSYSYMFLVIMLPFSLFPWLWNGYMDGLLAFYFCIALLLFDRYMKEGRSIDLVSSLASALFLLYIKNEGNLALLVLLFAFAVYYVIEKKPFKQKLAFKFHWRYAVITITALIPFIIWGIYIKRWGISNDLGLGTESSFDRLFLRLTDGSLEMIISKIFKYINASLMLLVLLLVSNLLFKRPFIKSSLPAIIATSLYILGMAAIYLFTPHDLVWHLNNSTVRVMELANGGFAIACYLLLQGLEDDPIVNEPVAIRHLFARKTEL